MQALQKVILVTAFEPFGDDALNPTEMLLERLPERLGGCEIRTLLLTVEFVRARERAFAAYDELRPDAVVMLGQAGGRSAITPESTGKNVMNARIPDNAGSMPEHLPIVKNGPETLRATLPIGKIIEDVSCLEFPASSLTTQGNMSAIVCCTACWITTKAPFRRGSFMSRSFRNRGTRTNHSCA